MKKLIFKNVGRDKWNGEVEIPNDANMDKILDSAYAVACKRLATRFPDVEYNQTNNKGTISAGYRTVGEFEVV